MAREKERGKKVEKWEPIWSQKETAKPPSDESDVVISKREEGNIEDLDKRLGELKESLDSMKEMTGKIGSLEDKMGELSSIYEAFISKYTPLESEKREGLLEEGEEKKEVKELSLEDDLMVLEWVDYLLGVMPRDEVGKRLSYFLDIGWLDEKLFEKALTLLHGLRDFSETDAEERRWKMIADDYVRSLMFLESLRGKPLDPNKLRAALFKARTVWREEDLEL
jgi:archaellum component FlaD/FlaE